MLHSNNNQFQVLIAGAGPVGLLLANFLGQAGISCLLFDKRSDIPSWSRAIGITPPSLEIIKQLGLHNEFVRRGVPIQSASVHDFNVRVGEVCFAGLNSDFNYILTLPQADNMQILEKNLARCQRVTFARGWELVAMHPAGDTVQVELREVKKEKKALVAGKWLVGCDGARSTVRSLAAIPFKRRFYRPRFIMADYEDAADWGDTAKLFFTAEGSLESFPLPGNKRRWVAQVPPETKNPVDTDFLEQRVKRLSDQDIKGLCCSRLFDFTPQRLKVKSFYKDRVILAGDAAHVITPIGGQGMNTGFADAHYLAEIMPRLLREEERVNDLLEAYSHSRKKAVGYSSHRAAAGMWLGTRRGGGSSFMRRLLLRNILLKKPLVKRVEKTFAMLTVPQ